MDCTTGITSHTHQHDIPYTPLELEADRTFARCLHDRDDSLIYAGSLLTFDESGWGQAIILPSLPILGTCEHITEEFAEGIHFNICHQKLLHLTSTV